MDSMDNNHDSTTVPSHKRVRRPKRPAIDTNKNTQNDDLKPPPARRPPMVVAERSLPQVNPPAAPSVPPARPPRTYDRTAAMSCARCRVYNWKEREFDRMPAPVKQPRRAPPPTTTTNQKAAPTPDDDIFRWNLSLEERMHRDSRSVLPTAKNLAAPPLPVRRTLPEEENEFPSETKHEMDSSAMHVDPSTSQTEPESKMTMKTRSSGRVSTAGSKPAASSNARKRRNGATASKSSPNNTAHLQTAQPTANRTGSRKRVMGQAQPMPLERSANNGTNSTNPSLDDSPSSVNSKEARRIPEDGETTNAESTGNAEGEQKHNGMAMDEQEKKHKSELTKRAMDELMKRHNFVEYIVADAISKNPLAFVHSLRDAKLLKSLERLSEVGDFHGSSEEAKMLRKQRKKEKKREKREKKKQKKLLKMAANIGVSIEQLELEMSMDRSDSRASAPGSRDGSLSLNGSLVGSATNTPPAILTPSSSAALSSLPGPPPTSYISVFPRPTFVPDPLNPLRNLAAECAAAARKNAASGTNTPPPTNADSPSPMVLPITPNSSILSNDGSKASSKRTDGHNMSSGYTQGVEEQSADHSKETTTTGDSSGTTPEDEEDEQNAIAISNLFSDCDAWQQLHLLKLCTDNKEGDVDEDEVASMIVNTDAGPSKKVVQTLVKEYREINGMRRVSEGGLDDSSPAGDPSQESEPRLIVIGDEEPDIDVDDSQDLIEQIGRNVTRNAWSAPALNQTPILSASGQAQTRSMDLAFTSQIDPKMPEQLMQSFGLNPQQQPCTSAQADADALNLSCMNNMGLTDLGFGLQPRLLSVLEQPITYSPVDDRPFYRTPAVIHTEMAVHEDEDCIYTSEMKVVTDWFNHAPYGAGTQAHMQYWDRVRQRVDVADWIRGLQGARSRQAMLNRGRKRKQCTTATHMRRSKSVETRWPRRLFDHYESTLETARQVLKTLDSTSDTETGPVVDNVKMKLLLLEEDDSAALAYFRPNSPLTVCDPQDDYQGLLLTHNLDQANILTKEVVQQLDDISHEGGLKKTPDYLPWLKIYRSASDAAGRCAADIRQSKLHLTDSGQLRSDLQRSAAQVESGEFVANFNQAVGLMNNSNNTHQEHLGVAPVADVPGTSMQAGGIQKMATFVQPQHTIGEQYGMMPSTSTQHCALPPATSGYTSTYPTSSASLMQQTPTVAQMVLPNMLQPSVSGLSRMPMSLALPMLNGTGNNNGTVPLPSMTLPPLSTVLDGLHQTQAGESMNMNSLFMQMPPRHSMHSTALAKNPYTDMFYHQQHNHHIQQTSTSAGLYPTTSGMNTGTDRLMDSFPSTSAMPHLGNNMRGNNMMLLHSAPNLPPATTSGSGLDDDSNVGLTKDSVVDQEMEAFFMSVLDECEQVPVSVHLTQGREQMFDNQIDPFLAMDQLT